MASIGIKQLRDNLSLILKRVEQGEIVRVLRHGKGVAELRPIKQSKGQELIGRLKAKKLFAGGGTGPIGPVKSVKNIKPEKPISDFVAEDRM